MKSAKKFPVSIRLRELKRFDPCPGGLEEAKEILGAEPELNMELSQLAAKHDLALPWIGKAMSDSANAIVAVKLVNASIRSLLSLSSISRAHVNVLKQTEVALRRVLRYLNKDDIAVLRLNLHVVFRVMRADPIVMVGYKALTSALSYLETADQRNDIMVSHAIDCVDNLAKVEAFLVEQRAKAPLFNFFVEALADEKRTRVLRTSAKKTAPKKASRKDCGPRKAPAKKTARRKK